MAEQKEIGAIQPKSLPHLFHLIHETGGVPQRRIIRLIAECGTELVVIIVFNARAGKEAVAGFEILMRGAGTTMQQQHLDARIVTHSFGPNVEFSLRRVDFDHHDPAAQGVRAAGIVEVTVRGKILGRLARICHCEQAEQRQTCENCFHATSNRFVCLAR